MPDPGVLQHRGSASQPVAGTPAGWCALGSELLERGLLSQASHTDLAGQQENQDQFQKSTGQPFPAGAQCQDPHGWGKRKLVANIMCIWRLGMCMLRAREQTTSFMYKDFHQSAGDDSPEWAGGAMITLLRCNGNSDPSDNSSKTELLMLATFSFSSQTMKEELVDNCFLVFHFCC